MEKIDELGLLDMRKAVLNESQNNEIYIPLHGKHTTNPNEEPFDLAEKICSFFVFDEIARNDPKVMLLMGDAGSGKSVFSQQLYQQLWKAYKSGDPIPLWIPLPELQNPFERAVEEVLTKYGFDDRQIAEIKAQEKFIFIVDGYDELHQFQNCYVTNKWEKWNAKVLMACRSQALYYQKDPDKYFMPFTGEKRLPMLLRRLYVASFSKEQISAYIKKYQQLNSEHKIFEEDFAKIPGLTELINTPFLLHLAVEALPDILANQVDDQKMTQAKLYDVFIERWFTRQIAKLSAAGLLKDAEQATKQKFWDYCKKLAQQMHEKEVSVIPYQGQKVGGRLFGKPTQKNIWDSFFNEETETVRSACPLRRYGEHHYGFVHASMVEYFATRSMYEEIQDNQHKEDEQYLEEKGKEDSDNRVESARDTNQPHGGIHQRLFSLERQSIQFLADRIEMSEDFKQKMLVILEASKKSERYAIGAANAITALVRAGFTFTGANLSGIRIPGADVSRGYFDSADLSGADLRQSQMKNVWLREASLQGSQLTEVNFGEYPRFMQDQDVDCFDFREDLKRLVMTNADEIMLCDLVKGDRLKILSGHEERVTSVKFSPDGKRLVSGSEDKTIRIWEVSSASEIAVLQGHEDKVTSVVFSSDGKRVVSGSDDMTVRVWDIANQVAIAVLQGHEAVVKTVAYSPDGQQVVSGSDDRTVRIWDINSRKALRVLQGHEDEVNSVAYSPHGKTIASGSEDNTVRIWDVVSGKPIARLCGHNLLVNSVAFSPQGERVISGSFDNTVRIWEIETQKEVACLRGHVGSVSCVQFSADGKRAISGSSDCSVRVWDIPEEPSVVRSRVDYRGYRVQLSPDGRWVVLGNIDGTVRICERQNRQEHIVLRGHTGQIDCVQFSPDGQQVVSGGQDCTIRIWDVEHRQEIRLLEGHREYVTCVQYDPKGTCVASGGLDGTVRLWSALSGKVLVVLQGHTEEVYSVTFSQDGKRILSGSDDKTVRLWEVSTGKLITLLEGFKLVMQAVFCPNEELVAVAGMFAITIVNVQSKQKICVLETGKIDNIQKIQFVGDGQRVIASGRGTTLQIWDIITRKCLHRQKFHTRIEDYSYHNDGSLVINFMDGSIECWQIMNDAENYEWKFNWTTNIDSPNLFVEGLVISDVMGLSDQNRRFLEQSGAVVVAKSEPTVQSSAKLNSVVTQSTVTPIQQAPTKEPTKGVVFEAHRPVTKNRAQGLIKKPLPIPPGTKSVNPERPIPAKRPINTVTPSGVDHSTRSIMDRSQVKTQTTSLEQSTTTTFTTAQSSVVSSKRPGFLNAPAPKPPIKGAVFKSKNVKESDHSQGLAKK